MIWIVCFETASWELHFNFLLLSSFFLLCTLWKQSKLLNPCCFLLQSACVINYCLLWCDFARHTNCIKMCKCEKQGPVLWVFLVHSSCWEIQMLVQEVFLLFGIQLSVFHCFSLASWRDQNGHTALNGNDNLWASHRILSEWTQRPCFCLPYSSRSQKRSSILAQCDITCLNYYHRIIQM